MIMKRVVVAMLLVVTPEDKVTMRVAPKDPTALLAELEDV